MPLIASKKQPAALCEWIEPSLREIPGQDPLGLQTITTDRILPSLLPGVLALSVRARYFSFFAFLLHAYEQAKGVPDQAALDHFVRQKEFEFCVAANLCDRCKAESVLGNSVGRPLVASQPASYPRQRSVQSVMGGYGLYYRSPMEELGLVIRRGEATVDGNPVPLDVLARNDRAQELAARFADAVNGTAWIGLLQGVDPLPAEVLKELGEAACPCRLNDAPQEREAIARALLEAPSPERAEATERRRQALAYLLDLAMDDPQVLVADDRFRAAAVARFTAAQSSDGPRGEAQGHWGAVVMREMAQDPLSAIWTSFCNAGKRLQQFEGMTRPQVRAMVRTDLFGSGRVTLAEGALEARPDEPAGDWLARLQGALAPLDWEGVRALSDDADAIMGLAVFVVLCHRVPLEADAGAPFLAVARVDGDRQPGLARMAQLVRNAVTSGATVLELLEWVIDNFIVSVHETVAMSKLPNATFRFAWEDGRLRFIDNGMWGFEMSGLRRFAVASLGRDLGWWVDGAVGPEVTAVGKAVVSDVMGS